MVATMTEKKDPNEKNVADDLFDDEPIIDLTDEVKIEPDAERKVSSSKSGDVIPPKADKDSTAGDDEDFIIFEENANSSLQGDPYTEGDRHSAEDDDRIGTTDKFEPDSHDDEDLFIMVDDQDSAEGDSTAIIDDDAIEMAGEDLANHFDEDIELEYEIDEEEIDFFSDDDEQEEDNEVITMPSEASDIDFEHEEGDEFKPLAELDNDEVDAVDDIIEITEFDQHFADDDEESIEHAGFIDPSGLKDEDFLELFDIDDESPEEDEEMKELSASEEKAVETELSRFFDDALEDEAGLDNDASQPVEKFSGLDMDTDLAMTAASLSSAAGKFDRLDTPLPQDPNKEKDVHMQKNSPASNAEDPPVVSTELIDQAIERIINEKLAGRIEHIIYEIIEKTVKREIDRLKESLFEDSPSDDDIWFIKPKI